jgi:hypothetical protein
VRVTCVLHVGGALSERVARGGERRGGRLGYALAGAPCLLEPSLAVVHRLLGRHLTEWNSTIRNKQDFDPA